MLALLAVPAAMLTAAFLWTNQGDFENLVDAVVFPKSCVARAYYWKNSSVRVSTCLKYEYHDDEQDHNNHDINRIHEE